MQPMHPPAIAKRGLLDLDDGSMAAVCTLLDRKDIKRLLEVCRQLRTNAAVNRRVTSHLCYAWDGDADALDIDGLARAAIKRIVDPVTNQPHVTHLQVGPSVSLPMVSALQRAPLLYAQDRVLAAFGRVDRLDVFLDTDTSFLLPLLLMLPNLHSLLLRCDLPLPAGMLAQLSWLPRLRSLDLEMHEPESAHVADLARLTNLTRLDVFGLPDLTPLTTLVQLREFRALCTVEGGPIHGLHALRSACAALDTLDLSVEDVGRVYFISAWGRPGAEQVELSVENGDFSPLYPLRHVCPATSLVSLTLGRHGDTIELRDLHALAASATALAHLAVVGEVSYQASDAPCQWLALRRLVLQAEAAVGLLGVLNPASSPMLEEVVGWWVVRHHPHLPRVEERDIAQVQALTDRLRLDFRCLLVVCPDDGSLAGFANRCTVALLSDIPYEDQDGHPVAAADRVRQMAVRTVLFYPTIRHVVMVSDVRSRVSVPGATVHLRESHERAVEVLAALAQPLVSSRHGHCVCQLPAAHCGCRALKPYQEAED